MYLLLTWGQWLTSSGFGGTAAVLAAALALIGVRRSSAIYRENARKDQWWDRLKWAVDMVLSGDEQRANVGLAALSAIAEAQGFDRDELTFLRRVTDLFLLEDESGTLEREPGTESADRPARGEEEADDRHV